MAKKEFKLGDVVVFEPKNLNPSYWNELKEADRLKYFFRQGYGASKPKLFVFITEINQAPGHCVLLDMDTVRIEMMCHTAEFRLATEDEI